MKDWMREMLVLAIITIGSTILVWLPFFLNLKSFWNIDLPNDGMAAVVRNFDGPYYIVTAKSLYQAQIIKQFEFDEPIEYYAAHYPVYPLLIRLLGPVMSYPYAMLGITAVFSVLAVWMFYFLLRELNLKSAYWLSLVFLVLPARWMIVRSVGSPESVFIFFMLFAVWGMVKKNYWIAGIAGALTQLTKPPGLLLFAAFGLYLLWNLFKKLGNLGKVGIKDLPWRAYPLLLIPLSLVSLWMWYGSIYGSFWAYFKSGDNIHLFWPPFQMFNTAAAWVGTFWLEEIIWLLLLGTLGVVLNWKRQDVISWLTIVWYLSIVFVSHRDFSRYALPMMPFLIIAFAPMLEKKEFRYVLLLMLLPIYLYTVNFIAGNGVAISDWGRLL